MDTLYIIQKQEKILVHYARKLTPSKICYLGQTSCGFLWILLQTLPHSHEVIFCPN